MNLCFVVSVGKFLGCMIPKKRVKVYIKNKWDLFWKSHFMGKKTTPIVSNQSELSLEVHFNKSKGIWSVHQLLKLLKGNRI